MKQFFIAEWIKSRLNKLPFQQIPNVRKTFIKTSNTFSERFMNVVFAGIYRNKSDSAVEELFYSWSN